MTATLRALEPIDVALFFAGPGVRVERRAYEALLAEAAHGAAVGWFEGDRCLVMGGVASADGARVGVAWMHTADGLKPGWCHVSAVRAFRAVIAAGALAYREVLATVHVENAGGGKLVRLLGLLPTGRVNGPWEIWRVGHDGRQIGETTGRAG